MSPFAQQLCKRFCSEEIHLPKLQSGPAPDAPVAPPVRKPEEPSRTAPTQPLPSPLDEPGKNPDPNRRNVPSPCRITR